MAVRTSTTAEVRWNNVKVAKVREISLEISRNVLDTTALGDTDSTAVYGVRSTTGSGTLFYDSFDGATISLMNSILADNTEPTDALTMVLDTGDGRQISGTVLLQSLQAAVSVGDLISVPISFTITGKPTGTF